MQMEDRGFAQQSIDVYVCVLRGLRWADLMLAHESTGLLEVHFKQQSKKPSMAACKCYNQAIQCYVCAVVHTSTAQQDARSPAVAAQQALIHHPWTEAR